MASGSIRWWLIANGSGTVGDIIKDTGLTLDAAQDRLDALVDEGYVEMFARLWDGSPVYRLVMQSGHNTESIMQRAGIIGKEDASKMERREKLDLYTGNYPPGKGDYDEEEDG